jgi:hypothetical protein
MNSSTHNENTRTLLALLGELPQGSHVLRRVPRHGGLGTRPARRRPVLVVLDGDPPWPRTSPTVLRFAPALLAPQPDLICRPDDFLD